MVQRSRNQGFTLVELVFAFALLVILLALTSVSMRPTLEQEGPRGLAHSLAADLRAARAQATRSGQTVAFCFASDGRSNSLSRSANIRVGEQKGKVWRTAGYESEYDATIFLGKWGAAIRESFEIPAGWESSTARETALYFAPDGHAYSEDILALEGRYPLVVASAMEGNFNGPEGTLSAARNPQTVWVSQTGTVEVVLNRLPLGSLPEGGSTDLSVARLTDDPPNTGSAPTILTSTFMPEQVAGLATAGIGQNFVQIHPNQKDGQQLEYGLATIEVKAQDVDGGPLRFRLSATASSGDSGKFSVSQQEGELRFVFDEAVRHHVWKTVVSWRPPPSAAADLNYQLTMVVSDPDGNETVVSTEAGLLPAVTSLPPARIVVNSSDRKLFLTNLDGANEVLLTRDGPEYSPFFSQDGSCVFSFHDTDIIGSRELRSRPANGSVDYLRLASFSGSTHNVVYDPTYTFAALTNPAGNYTFDWGLVTQDSGGGGGGGEDGDGDDDGGGSPTFSEGVTSVPVSNVLILNLMSTDPPISVTNKGNGEFFWAANARHTFYFGEQVKLPEIMESGFGPFSPVPGYQTVGLAKYLIGFPPVIVDSEVAAVSAAGRVYNPANRDWYLLINGHQLTAANDVTGASQVIFTSAGGFETSPTGRLNPSWSADGQKVAFITSPGAGAKVVSMHVLDSSFALRGSPETNFELNIEHPSLVQLSPGGEWVYFLHNGNVMRAVNRTGESLVDITDHLGVDVVDYVISP